MAKPRYYTTVTDFRWFQRHVKHYMKRYRLSHWIIQFRHEQPERSISQVLYDEDEERATFILAKDWDGQEVSAVEIRITALHEVAHLVMAKLCTLAEQRHISKGQIDEEEHMVISRMIHAEFEEVR